MADYSPDDEAVFRGEGEVSEHDPFLPPRRLLRNVFQRCKDRVARAGATLTGRDCGQAERAPMCGVPFHSAGDVSRALWPKGGYKVAICEQMEDPALAKGIVKRSVIRVITPGTVMESSMLDEAKNNYIASIYYFGENIGICFADISTGELDATTLTAKGARGALPARHQRAFALSPREILINLKFTDFGTPQSSSPKALRRARVHGFRGVCARRVR